MSHFNDLYIAEDDLRGALRSRWHSERDFFVSDLASYRQHLDGAGPRHGRPFGIDEQIRYGSLLTAAANRVIEEAVRIEQATNPVPVPGANPPSRPIFSIQLRAIGMAAVASPEFQTPIAGMVQAHNQLKSRIAALPNLVDNVHIVLSDMDDSARRLHLAHGLNALYPGDPLGVAYNRIQTAINQFKAASEEIKSAARDIVTAWPLVA